MTNELTNERLAAIVNDTVPPLLHHAGPAERKAMAAELLAKRHEVEAARKLSIDLTDVLRRNGFRKCDVMACNCGSWHQVDGYAARFREIDEAVGDHNGKTLLQAVQEIVAEIAKEKARADAMRKALIQCGRNVGGGLSDDVSDDFLMHVPEEARLVVDRLRAELAAKQPVVSEQQRRGFAFGNTNIENASITREMVNEQAAKAEAAQQGPSDTLIAEAMERCGDDDDCSAATYHALLLLARRAGVKL